MSEPVEARHRVTVELRGDELVDVLDAVAALSGCSPREAAAELLEAELHRARRDPDVAQLVRARRRRRARRGLRLAWRADVDEITGQDRSSAR